MSDGALTVYDLPMEQNAVAPSQNPGGIFMPQPLVEGCQLEYRPMLLKDRPERAMGIALVAAEWAALENHLIQLFKFCLFALQGESQTSGQIAQTAWENIGNLNTRLDLLESIARQRIPLDLLQEFKDTIKPEIRRRSIERNRVVHGHWHLCDKYPDDVILESYEPSRRLRYNVHDFDDIAARIISTSNLLATFWLGKVSPRLSTLAATAK